MDIRSDPRYKRFGPRIVLPAFGSHSCVGRAQPLRVRRNPTSSIQFSGGERPDYRPSTTQSRCDYFVQIARCDDLIAHQAIGLSQQCALKTIEHEAFDLGADSHRRHLGASH